MTEPAFGHTGMPLSPPPGRTPPVGDSWVTSLWQEMFTADSGSMLDGATTVTPTEQPLLWHWVRQVASESECEPPDALRLVGQAHSVTHENPYTLDIGVPFLLALDQADLAEVVSRVMRQREEGAEDDSQGRPEKKSRFGRLSSKLRGGSSVMPRKRRPSGTERLENAVREATQWWIDEFVLPDLTDNLVPRPVYVGLAELLAERGAEIADAAGLEPRDDYDENPMAGEPALSLLVDPDTLLENVAQAGLPPGTGELDWDDAMARWANRRSRASSIILFRAAQPPVTSLWQLLDVIERGDLPVRVANALRSPQATSREDCIFLLTGTLTDAFADVGAGTLTCSWGGTIDLVNADDGPMDLSGVARQVVDDPSVVPFLRDILTEFSVSPDWAPSDAGTADDRALQEFLATSGPRQAPGTGFLGLNASS